MAIEIAHSTDAGRYGGSEPTAIVRGFQALAANGDALDKQTTTQGVTVELAYTPDNMNVGERQQLLGELLSFAQDQESWHGDWFLWNLVRVTDTASQQEIRMSIV